MEKVEPREELHFVALEVTNEMPAYGDGDEIHLWQGFLHAILTDVSNTGIPGRLNGVRAMRLGYSDDRHPLSVTTAPSCRLDSISNFSQPVREVWKRHNVASYRRLQSESREALGVGRPESARRAGHE